MHCMRRPRSPKKRTKIDQADLLRSDRIRIIASQDLTDGKNNPSIQGVVFNYNLSLEQIYRNIFMKGDRRPSRRVPPKYLLSAEAICANFNNLAFRCNWNDDFPTGRMKYVNWLFTSFRRCSANIPRSRFAC